MKRKLWTLVAIGVFCVIGIAATIFGEAVPTGSWGLRFHTEGQPPEGSAGVGQLQKYDSAFLGDTGEKTVYLTFDAGYENGCTEKILDTLKKHNVKCLLIFFKSFKFVYKISACSLHIFRCIRVEFLR